MAKNKATNWSVTEQVTEVREPNIEFLAAEGLGGLCRSCMQFRFNAVSSLMRLKYFNHKTKLFNCKQLSISILLEGYRLIILLYYIDLFQRNMILYCVNLREGYCKFSRKSKRGTPTFPFHYPIDVLFLPKTICHDALP